MGCETCKICAFLLVSIIVAPFFVYADQYYDPVTRRYVQGVKMQRNPAIQRQAVNQNILPTQQEIEAERQRIEQEEITREQERQRYEEESDAIQARRKFDPNRYHRTEDILIIG